MISINGRVVDSREFANWVIFASDNIVHCILYVTFIIISIIDNDYDNIYTKDVKNIVAALNV